MQWAAEKFANWEKRVAKFFATLRQMVPHSTKNRLLKTPPKLALALLAGVAIGLFAAQGIHAQQVKAPPAYVIAEVEMDPS